METSVSAALEAALQRPFVTHGERQEKVAEHLEDVAVKRGRQERDGRGDQTGKIIDQILFEER